jgi:hypothetical protein
VAWADSLHDRQKPRIKERTPIVAIALGERVAGYLIWL